jgi:hypothetical protein
MPSMSCQRKVGGYLFPELLLSYFGMWNHSQNLPIPFNMLCVSRCLTKISGFLSECKKDFAIKSPVFYLTTLFNYTCHGISNGMVTVNGLLERITKPGVCLCLPVILPSFLSLVATTQGELWPPEQSASILLYSEADCPIFEQFSFYGSRLLASCPTPKLEDQGISLRLAPTP